MLILVRRGRPPIRAGRAELCYIYKAAMRVACSRTSLYSRQCVQCSNECAQLMSQPPRVCAFCSTTTTTPSRPLPPSATMIDHLVRAHPLELRPARAIQKSPWPSTCKDWMYCADTSRIDAPDDERVEEEWEYQIGWKSVLSHLFASPGILTTCVKPTGQREVSALLLLL